MVSRKRSPGTGRFPKTSFASMDFRNRYQGFQEPFPKQDFQEHVFPKQHKVPRAGFQASVSRKGFAGRGVQARFPASFPSKISGNMFVQAKQGSQNRFSSKCFQKRFSGRGAQAKFPSKVPSKLVRKQIKQCFQEEVPKQGSQPQLPRNRCPYKVLKNRFTSKIPKHVPSKVPKQGSQQQVPRNRFPNRFPKSRFTSKVPGKSSQAMFPGKGSQARFPGTASQARLQEEVRKQGFPVVPGNFAWEPALPGNACLRTCSCEPCSCLESCLETVPVTLLGNRFWELYLQAVSKNLTLLGNLFLDTLLGSLFLGAYLGTFFPNSVSLGSSATPGTRFLIKFSRNRFASKVTRNDFSSQVPKNGFPGKVPKQGFQKQLPSKVPKNRFPRQVPRNRFPRKGCKKGFQE